MLQWRNPDLDFSSIGALQASLAASPTEPGLTRAPTAEDILVLEHAARDEHVRALAVKPAAIARLWDACQVPDYRKIAPATHAELVVTLYGFLMREGNIPIDWFAQQVAQADRTDGGIDTLSNRIAHVRTWTFIANRPDWLADPEHWQGVTRAIEDKLSDALHERLAERFVDRRTSVLMRRLLENTMLETEIGKTGEVTVEGHVIGRLEGFMFAPDASAAGSEAKALNAAAQKALAGEIETRATKLSQASNDQIVLVSDGALRWTGDVVGKLIAGDDVLRPRVRIVADEQLTGPARELVQTRLDLWLKTHIEKLLAPLFSLTAADDVTGMARGIAFQLVESLGVLERARRWPRRSRASTSRRARPCANTACASAPITSICRSCSSRRRARWRRNCGRLNTRARTPKASANCCISPPAGEPRSRWTRRHRNRSTAPPAIAWRASARCASIFWSGSPISSARRCPGAKPRPAPSRTACSTAAVFWSPAR